MTLVSVSPEEREALCSGLGFRGPIWLESGLCSPRGRSMIGKTVSPITLAVDKELFESSGFGISCLLQAAQRIKKAKGIDSVFMAKRVKL